MYVDHRTATAVQTRRIAELRRMAAQQRQLESRPALDPSPTPADSVRWYSLASLARRLHLRHA